MPEKAIPTAKGTVDLEPGDHIDEVEYAGKVHKKVKILSEHTDGMKVKWFVVQLDEKVKAKIRADTLKLV